MDPKPGDGGERRRIALAALGGVGLGLALGVAIVPEREKPAPRPTAIATPEPAAPVSASTAAPSTADATTKTIAAITSPRPPDIDARLASLDGELATLARSLADPSAYDSPRAALDDLAAFDDVSSRRASLLASADRAASPPPTLPSSLRERARAIARSGSGLSVVGAPPDVEYVAAASLLGDVSPGERGGRGVALAPSPGGPRIAFRSVRGGVERRAVIVEDRKTGRDVLRVEYGDPEGAVHVRRESVLGAIGSTYHALAERLWSDGRIEHRALEDLVARPLSRPPRYGFADWLRRHLDLPRNRDLGEEWGPPPPLARQNPLLLRDGRARPAMLERTDLTVDPSRSDPPLPMHGPTPLVLIAANAVAIYDASWRWLVFDPVGRRVVDHAELESGDVEHVSWDFLPEPERFPAARRGDLIDALYAQAAERTRQAIALIVLPGEVSSLALELRAKEGGALTSDGLEALRLRNEVLSRQKKLDALAHLLLDEEGITTYERALDRATLETAREVIAVIEGMIEAGRDGPAEYLLRDERVRYLLFHPPVTRDDRDKLRKAFRERFRPWSVRVSRALSGAPTHWYDEDE